MTSDPVHPEDEIQELLDGRLRPERRAEVEQHLAGCAECRRLREALSYVREAVRTGLPAERLPELIGRTLRRAVKADQLLQESDLA